tara:strand:+ start:2541 stop:4682 length:2142 start_codon:yes stop_codon:yes gene_type:complete
MKLVKIKLENFLTYEELDYDFEDKALLVQGINLTDKNQKSNGSGKSAIQTGIEFALTASNSRGVNDSELVTYGFDESKVKLFIQCDSRKETLEIDWTIKVKGSNKLSLKLNDKEISFSNVNDGKRQILNWLGISKEDLFNYFIINSTRFKSFFGSSNREKVDLINRFSDSSIIDGLDDIDNSQFEGEKLDLENKINRAEGGIEIIVNQIDEANKVDFEDEYNSNKDDLESQINVIETKVDQFVNLIKENESEKKEIKVDIKVIENKIKEIEESKTEFDKQIDNQQRLVNESKSDYDKAVSSNDEVIEVDFKEANQPFLDLRNKTLNDILLSESEISKIKVDINKVKKFLSGIDVKLGGAITCPSCSHIFILDGDREVLLTKESQGKSILEKLELKIPTFNDKILADKKLLDGVDLSISNLGKEEQQSIAESRVREEGLSAIRRELNKSEDNLSSTKRKSLKTHEKISDKINEIKELNSEYKEISREQKFIKETNIPDLETKIKELRIDIKNLKEGDNKEAIKKLKSSVKGKEEEIINLNKKLITVNDIIYNRNKWSNNFKQFRLHLANKSLETMQYRTNHFLKELGNDIVIRLDGYKVKANGTIKEEISAVVIRDGERTFSSLSGGEQVRVLFSSILANRYLINSTHPHGGLDFLGVDEIFDKIDSLGMKHLIMSAKKLETCIMIISHVSDEELAGEDILTIVKENGVSTIKK